MFLLKKTVAPFLLPPGLFISLLLVTGLWALRRGNRAAAAIALLTGMLVWALSVGPIADRITAPLESPFSVPADIQGDVIIMLGGGVHARSDDLTGIGAPSHGTMERLVTVARLHRRLRVPIILSGGIVQPDDGAAASALLSRRFLIDLGIPPDHILVDTQSRDTYENAVFSKQLCERHGFHKPLLVTSGSHLKRALFSFEAVGLSVTPIPCGLTTWPDKRYAWHAWLPSANALAATSDALHEWLGLIYYRIAH